MYDRPNARKGRYLKIHNMLISVAAPMKYELKELWMLFNIIYIMRTKVDSGGIWRNAVVIALVTERCDAIMARYAGSGFRVSALRFTSRGFLMAFNFSREPLRLVIAPLQ
nr:hypothetical protein [Cronobacter dublinensis]